MLQNALDVTQFLSNLAGQGLENNYPIVTSATYGGITLYA